MEGLDGSPPNSMHMVNCREMFPKPQLEKEHEKIQIPFTELPGEGVKYVGNTVDGILALTNYRIFVLKCAQEKSVPLGLIDTVQSRDLFHLFVYCKDANTVKCSFDTAERCAEWQRRITVAVSNLLNLESLFAFPFYAWSNEIQSALQSVSSNSRSPSPLTNHSHHNNHQTAVVENEWTGRLRKIGGFDYDDDFRREVDRLQFNLRGAWRISKINEDFKLCPSYPRYFLVPIYITDETLQSVANFRSSRRIPVAVWRHKVSGAIIARCSQPEVGWLGWRNSKDEELLQAFVNACAFDRGEQQLQQQQQQQQQQNIGSGLVENGSSLGYQKAIQNGVETNGNGLSENESTTSSEGSHEEVQMDEPKKMLIVDARSYASAVTNRARGGGCECIEYYPSADIQFMSLGNIHAIRKSFHSLRQLCASPPDMNNWLSNLEKTMWLQHLSGLLAASVTVCRAIELNGRPVLVHCSDGWDRTPQIVATAQLCLDPYYRTVNGFRTLVEREWLSFGHKFGDRCGHGPNSDDLNERCPVFLQWLDCVHQIHLQFPCSFEFSTGYLIKLAQHSHSCLFGTFLGNTVKERTDERMFNRTYSVWPFLSGPMYKNPLYILPNRDSVLWPAHNLRDLSLWNEVYLGSLGNQVVNTETSSSTSLSLMSKMESVVGNTTLEDERMVSMIEDGVDEDNGLMMKRRLGNPLSIDVEDDQTDGEIEGDQVEPTSPMSKTRSYGDLLEVNGAANGPQRRSSDPTVPIELLKYGPNQAHKPKVEIHCDRPATENEKVVVMNGGGGGQVVRRDERDALVSSTTLLPNLVNSINIDKTSNANHLATTQTNEARATVHSSLMLIGRHNNSSSESSTTSTNNSATDQIVEDLITILKDESRLEQQQLQKNAVSNMHQNGNDQQRLMGFCPSAVEAREHTLNGDSVDGGGRIGYKSDGDFNMMLESVDLRDTSAITGLETQSSINANGANNLWHGNIETSTDTLVPIADDKEDGVAVEHCSTTSSLSNFITKREENEETRLNRIADSVVVDDLNLLNISQSIFEVPNKFSHPPRVAAVNDQLNDRLSDVIQNAHSGLPRRHRRRRNSSTNSKSEISPNKFHNGNVSPATNSSRFSTPGARSLPLTPPGSGVPFEKGTVAISCPDGLAHALSEQNLRLQQIIYEHKLREEKLQRELNATKMALLKQICYHCNNSQPSSANNDEQNTGLSVEIGGEDHMHSQHLLTEHIKALMMMHFADDEEGSGDGSEEDDANDDIGFEGDEEDDEEEDNYDPPPSMSTAFFRQSSLDCRGYLSPVAKVNNNMDAGENASVCSWEAVEERGTGSGASSANNSCNGDGSSKVLWVPDHAVSKCTGCSIDFWIGRRKHHCRSCGKIFCSDCSEFFAPLPDESLYNPVRLCGPCYHAVTTRLQEQHLEQQQQQHLEVGTSTINSRTSANYSIENQNYNHHMPPMMSLSAALPPSITSEESEEEQRALLIKRLSESCQISSEAESAAEDVVIPHRVTSEDTEKVEEESKRKQSQQQQSSTGTTTTITTMSSHMMNSYGLDMACKSSVSSSAAAVASQQASAMHTSNCGNGLKTATASN